MLNPCKNLKELVRDFATKVLRIEDLELYYENNTGMLRFDQAKLYIQ
jgi:hypothetical protein